METAVVQTLWPWFVSIDGAMLVVSLIFRAFTKREVASFAELSLAFFLVLGISAVIWDAKHPAYLPFSQFPFNIRLYLTIPAMAFGNSWLVLALRNRTTYL